MKLERVERTYDDGHKTYVNPQPLDDLSGLRRGGFEVAEPFKQRRGSDIFYATVKGVSGNSYRIEVTWTLDRATISYERQPDPESEPAEIREMERYLASLSEERDKEVRRIEHKNKPTRTSEQEAAP